MDGGESWGTMDNTRCAECYYCEVCKPITNQSVRENCKEYKQGRKSDEQYWREMSHYKLAAKSMQQRLREGE